MERRDDAELLQEAIDRLTAVRDYPVPSAIQRKLLSWARRSSQDAQAAYIIVDLTDEAGIDAHLSVLRAALQEIRDVDDDPDATYPDGRKMSGARLLKVTPLGRAAFQLARAVVGDATHRRA